jgi:hypothetical protein
MSQPSVEDEKIIARLDKPGAGVPLFQKLFFTWWLRPFVAARSDWEADSRGFEALNRKIFKALEGLDEAALQRRILVKPITGLEDSSRYWSAAMTVEHLLIVGEGIKKGIIALSNGIVPDRKIDTAKVKPKGDGSATATIAAYRAFAETAQRDIDAKVGDRKSKATLFHPWFGPFTAHQFHWLLTAHAAIHLKQIRQIVEGLQGGIKPENR